MVPNKDVFGDFNQILNSSQLCVLVLVPSCVCLLLSSCLALQLLRFVMYLLPGMYFCLQSAIRPSSLYPVHAGAPVWVHKKCTQRAEAWAVDFLPRNTFGDRGNKRRAECVLFGLIKISPKFGVVLQAFMVSDLLFTYFRPGWFHWLCSNLPRACTEIMLEKKRANNFQASMKKIRK